MPDHRWRCTDSRYLFQSRWYAVRQDALVSRDGQAITYTVVEHPGFVVIVPLLSDGRAVMERIDRYPLQRVQLECPSGGLDGEAPELAAQRELEEETGYRADRLIDLGKYAASTRPSYPGARAALGIHIAFGHFASVLDFPMLIFLMIMPIL
jgi:8-oxo-dGTP pyrophosphatase MutT (NUDIX family)